MKKIKILGTGCGKCQRTLEMVQSCADRLGIAIEIEKIEDIESILGYGVMATPAVVIDEVVVHTGGVPAPNEVNSWLQTA